MIGRHLGRAFRKPNQSMAPVSVSTTSRSQATLAGVVDGAASHDQSHSTLTRTALRVISDESKAIILCKQYEHVISETKAGDVPLPMPVEGSGGSIATPWQASDWIGRDTSSTEYSVAEHKVFLKSKSNIFN